MTRRIKISDKAFRDIAESRSSPILLNIIEVLSSVYGIDILRVCKPDRPGFQPIKSVILNSDCYETDSFIHKMVHFINSTWIFDSNHYINKPVEFVANIKKPGEIHIKVHDNTIRRFY